MDGTSGLSWWNGFPWSPLSLMGYGPLPLMQVQYLGELPWTIVFWAWGYCCYCCMIRRRRYKVRTEYTLQPQMQCNVEVQIRCIDPSNHHSVRPRTCFHSKVRPEALSAPSSSRHCDVRKALIRPK